MNAVANYAGLSCTKEEVSGALASLGLDGNVRGETLNLQQFAALSNILT